MSSFKNKLLTLGLFTTMAAGMFGCDKDKGTVDPIGPGTGVVTPKETVVDTFYSYKSDISVLFGYAENVETGSRSIYFGGTYEDIPTQFGSLRINTIGNDPAKIDFLGFEDLTVESADRNLFVGHAPIAGENGKIYENAMALVATSTDSNGFLLSQDMQGNKKYAKVCKVIFNQFRDYAGLSLGPVTREKFIETTLDVHKNGNYEEYFDPTTKLKLKPMKYQMAQF